MLNMDFSRRVVINTAQQVWQASPKAGVWRKPLARENQESGHATSVVKYDAGASFRPHPHPGGEEILVLSGVFSDHSGDYGPGAYLRNPEGFSHAPFSDQGCEILVKLHQFQADDRQQLAIDTNCGKWLAGQGALQVMPLHQHRSESVALVFWPAGASLGEHLHPQGEEIYVISGELIDDLGTYPAGTWLRNPPRSSHRVRVERDTLIWVKTGHLI